jgi:hypothetical protein
MCPSSWVCTWDEGAGRVTVRLGSGQRAVLFGGVWRYAPAYPSGDGIHDICRFSRADPREEYVPESNQPSCR